MQVQFRILSKNVFVYDSKGLQLRKQIFAKWGNATETVQL